MRAVRTLQDLQLLHTRVVGLFDFLPHAVDVDTGLPLSASAMPVASQEARVVDFGSDASSDSEDLDRVGFRDLGASQEAHVADILSNALSDSVNLDRVSEDELPNMDPAALRRRPPRVSRLTICIRYHHSYYTMNVSVYMHSKYTFIKGAVT